MFLEFFAWNQQLARRLIRTEAERSEWTECQAGREIKADLLVGQQDQKDQLHHLYQGLPTLKGQGKKACIVSTHNRKAPLSIITANHSHTHSLAWDSCIACFSRFSRITLNCRNKNDQVQMFFHPLKYTKMVEVTQELPYSHCCPLAQEGPCCLADLWSLWNLLDLDVHLPQGHPAHR